MSDILQTHKLSTADLKDVPQGDKVLSAHPELLLQLSMLNLKILWEKLAFPWIVELHLLHTEKST